MCEHATCNLTKSEHILHQTRIITQPTENEFSKQCNGVMLYHQPNITNNCGHNISAGSRNLCANVLHHLLYN